MRLSESEVIVDTLSEAGRNAGSTGTINVDALLSKPEFVKSLRELWAHIPEKTRRSIGRRQQRTSHERRRLRAHDPHLSNITLSETLMADIPQWSQNPRSFFQEGGDVLNLEVSPVAQLYQYLEQLNNRRTIDTIRARFIKIVFHRLKERLCLRYLRSKDVDNVAWILSESGFRSCDFDSIKRKIIRWTDLGGRLDALCRSIGSSAAHEDSHLGNLFCLPEDCHDEFVRVLNYAGPVRDQKIQRIKDRGILNVQRRTDLEKLAVDVFGILWTKVTSSIEDIITRTSGSDLGRNLQHMHSFRIEQEPPRAVLQPNSLIPTDEPSHVSDAVENVRSDSHSPRYTTQDSAVAIHVSPTVASRLRQSPNHSNDDVTNQLTDGIIPHNVRNMIDIHDMLQPILPVRDNVEQPHGNTANMVDVHDMIQSILPAHAFSLFDGQSNEDIGDMVNVHDMLQPINMAPPIPPAQVDRQVPTMDDRMFAPRMTDSQDIRTRNTYCGPFSQPVSAT